MSVPANSGPGRERWATVDALSAAIVRLGGRREAAVEQADALEAAVALAKGRLNARKPVEAFLEQVQADQNRRNVEAFETLLTAFAQEVLPWTSPIRLELTTERNLPSLDIEVERADGEREDVFEDNGGGLTNVVVAGLRLIAVVKSHSGRFVTFDEPDCWVAPDRVHAFFRLLEDAARRLGIQCFIITHHDVRSFGGEASTARIEGHPDTGVSVARDGEAPSWPDDSAAGIRSVRLVDVQGYPDATLDLSPGVTMLTGPNGHGKSSFSRAFRAMFFGDARDSLIRHGRPSCRIEMRLAGGRTLSFTRKRKGNPVNTWTLNEPDGSVVEDGGLRHETGGRTVPDWVGRLTGIRPVQELDVHVAHQKKPVFLLSEPPAKRASVLSVGQEADHVRRMITLHRDRCNQDTVAVREGERQIDGCRRLVARLDMASGLGADVDDLKARAGEIDAATANVERAEAVLAGLARARTRLETSRAREAALSGLPARGDLDELVSRLAAGRGAEEVQARLVGVLDEWGRADARAQALDLLPGAPPTLTLRDSAIPLGKRVADARKGGERARSLLSVLSDLPLGVPTANPTAGHERALALLHAARTGGERARAEMAGVEGRIATVRARASEVLDQSGGACPACGQHVDDASMLIREHVHG